jgi:hypothetical protein
VSASKKAIRERFRTAVFTRARYRCEVCGFASTPEKARDELDAHHVTDRNLLPAGGYVAENGISLCKPCHEKAEVFHSTGSSHPGYDPAELYVKIKSHFAAAYKASQKLERESGK